MNIIVCIKQTPDTEKVKFNPETRTLLREGVENIMNPFDMQALETALIMKDKFGGKVTCISMGLPQATDVLKEALAMGADAVIIARPFVTAVYGGEEEGVKCYIEKIKAELSDTMAMCGAHSIAEITSDMVRKF